MTHAQPNSTRRSFLKGGTFSAAAMLASAGPRPAADSGTETTTMRIALAAIRREPSILAGVEKIKGVLAECREKRVQIVCFSETYLPGLRGGKDDGLPAPNQPLMERALESIRLSCGEAQVAAIVGMEWQTRLGLENRAFVISAAGRLLGHQTKNQITPDGESRYYVPDGKRRMFEIAGVKIGVVICHEGWRYPETVRWAAVREAKIVFQPQVTGSHSTSESAPTAWGQSFYEMAMQCRAQENSVYFASVNEAMPHQNSATSLIDPAGKLMKYVPRGQEEVLVADLDLTKATGFYAKKFRPDLYRESAESEL